MGQKLKLIRAFLEGVPFPGNCSAAYLLRKQARPEENRLHQHGLDYGF